MQDDTPIFGDRREAARLLAIKLSKLSLSRPLVLAVPRGGVVTGYIVALWLHAELDVITPRKLPDPEQPELALGAVMHDGTVFLNEAVIALRNVRTSYLREVTERETTESQRRLEAFRAGRPALHVKQRNVLIVDDGIATGATMIVAARWLRAAGASHIIIAAPVMPAEILPSLEREADHVVCLSNPALFSAVGQFYKRFEQVDDAEVKRLLYDFWG